MRLDDAKDREHGAVALATWAYLADICSVPHWKAFVSVVITVLLALAALTRNPNWAMAIRFLTGGWLIAAPVVFRFNDVAPVLWSYLVIGTLVATAATPGIAGRLGGRAGTVGC